MVKLRRLTIHKYRNVVPETTLEFGDGINVLLGKNGAGKTTLLKVISAVLRSDFRSIEGEYQFSYVIEFPEGRAEVSVRPASIVDPVRDPSRPSLQHEVEHLSDVEIYLWLKETNQPLRFYRKDSLYVLDGEKGEKPMVPADRIIANHVYFVVAMSRQYLERGPTLFLDLGSPFRIDESLDMFRRVLDESFGSPQNPDEPEEPVFLVFRNTDGRIHAMGANGLTAPLWEPLNARLDRDNDLRQVLFPHTDLEFLGNVVRLGGFRAAELRLELIQTSVQDGTEYSHLGKPRIWFTGRDGSVISQQLLSYGQKRLLAFFYYLAAQPSTVVADELVNGLHYDWIEECVKAIGQRQAFLTSQNPLLLDCLPFETIEQVKGSFVMCESKLENDREHLEWRNFSDDEADEFLKAYKVGFQDVGQILRTKGLW